jgi:hypothetical protein
MVERTHISALFTVRPAHIHPPTPATFLASWEPAPASTSWASSSGLPTEGLRIIQRMHTVPTAA